jgi:hypothetical protein
MLRNPKVRHRINKSQFNPLKPTPSYLRTKTISLTEYNNGTIQNFPFGVNTTIELKNITATSDSTGTPVSRNTPRWMPLL